MKLKRIILTVAAGLLSLGMLSGCVDQSGGQAALSQSEESRIVATSVATCEILDRLGVPAEQVVGVPHSDSYVVPQQYADATSVGNPMAPDMEIVKSLNPTIVLSPNSLEGDLKPQYDSIGVDSYFLNLKSVDGMFTSIQELGEMLGCQEAAAQLLQEYKTFKADYQQQVTSQEAPTVLILMGLPGSYVVATESSYAGSLVKLAGGVNVYGDGDGTDFLNVNTEDMLSKDPDIILRTSHAMPEQVAVMFAEEFSTNDIWSHFRAVQEGQVYDLDHEKFGMSATFRYQDALADLKPILYGEE